MESKCVLVLKLPRFFSHRIIGEWKNAASSKQTYLMNRSYIALALEITKILLLPLFDREQPFTFYQWLQSWAHLKGYLMLITFETDEIN